MRRSQDEWIGHDCWEELLKKMPIPCVDVIVHRDREFLMGWRTIPPYKDVWALIGGRVLRGESFEEVAIRHCRESGLRISEVQQLGVYPVVFRSRHDITVCVTARMISGVPRPTKEMTRYRWFRNSLLGKISPIGGNYRKMLRQWLSRRR